MEKNSASVEPKSGGKNSQTKISIDELQTKIADPKIAKEDLYKYLLIDRNASGVFTPKLAPNPNTVEVSDYEGAVALGQIFTALFNESERKRRLQIFNDTIKSGYTGPIIVSEGDSWFMWFLSPDIIDNLRLYGFAIRSLEAMGDTLEKMVKEAEYIDALPQTKASVFLLSGGGNDALGGGDLIDHLRDFDPSRSPAQHLKPSFYELVNHAMAMYRTILENVQALSAEILIICHGYDYCIPSNDKWLGQPMNARGITDSLFQTAIVGAMIDEFNFRLQSLVDTFSSASYLDLRGTVGPGRWADELHPGWTAFGEIAAKFKAQIDYSLRS